MDTKPDRPETVFTPDQIDEFVRSTVWREIEATLRERLELVRDDFEKPEFAEVRTVARLQGEAATLRYVIGLPEKMREETSQEKEDEDYG